MGGCVPAALRGGPQCGAHATSPMSSKRIRIVDEQQPRADGRTRPVYGTSRADRLRSGGAGARVCLRNNSGINSVGGMDSGTYCTCRVGADEFAALNSRKTRPISTCSSASSLPSLLSCGSVVCAPRHHISITQHQEHSRYTQARLRPRASCGAACTSAAALPQVLRGVTRQTQSTRRIRGQQVALHHQ